MQRLFSVILLLLTPLGACSSRGSGGTGSGEPAPASTARLAVENRSSDDMDIYVHVEGTPPTRVGFAPGSDTTVFQLSPALIVGAKPMRFEARPSRGGESVFSDPFDVRPGEEVNWSIPPQ
jgi:hypothetical protein